MIDPKELHIGSHVKYQDKIYRVFAIDERKQQVELCVYGTNTNHISRSIFCGVESINPIPITAELLTELGFKMTNEISDEHHIAWVREKPLDAYIEYNMNAKLFFAHFGPFNEIRVDYLHEAEFAFYLAYKQELIKE